MADAKANYFYPDYKAKEMQRGPSSDNSEFENLWKELERHQVCFFLLNKIIEKLK